MYILSIDTASDICGVSILKDTTLIEKLDTKTGRTHSENLMPMIEEIFVKTKLSLKDIDLLVCDKGPGSFTGIRIGVSTVMGFSDSLSIPTIGISSLEALAYQVKDDGYICAMLDARNENCYYGLYYKENNEYTEIVAPSSDWVEASLKNIKEYIKTDQVITFIGDGSISFVEPIKTMFPNALFSTHNELDSYCLGLAGYTKYKKGIQENILPLYLKKPQAQIQLEEKLKNENK